MSQQTELYNVAELLNDYLRILKKMWKWAVLLAIVGMAWCYISARTSYEPMYTASATFTVNITDDVQGSDNSSQPFFANSTAEQMAKTFPYILTSGVLRRQVADDMGMDIGSSIEASVAENTNLFTISVTDRDPGVAYAVLQSVIKNYPEISEVIVGKTVMHMLDETGVPPYPNNPKDFKGAAIKGAILGVLIVAAWAVLLVMTRRTIRKSSDIQKYMNTKCLGVIPEIKAKRRTIQRETKILLTNSSVEEKLQEPFRLIRNKLEHYARSYQMKVFVVTSALAGEGKSTVAVNLALSLVQAGHRVALVDCDLRHPSDRAILGAEDGMGLGEVLQRKCKLRECTLTAKGLGLNPAFKLVFVPGGEAIEDGSRLLGTDAMERIIDSLRQKMDYVILDSAPVGLLTDAVVLSQFADGAVFVVRKDCARIDHIMDGMEGLASSRVQIIGGILNGD